MKSRFALDIKNMLQILHNVGLELKYMDVFLEEFDEYCSQNYPYISVLTENIAEKWIHNYTTTSKQQMDKRIRTMKHLGRYQRSIGKEAYLPLYRIKANISEEPYLFTDVQLAEFFTMADKLQPHYRSPNREIIFPVMFRVIYCCGLRSSEACNLKVCDVDPGKGTLSIYHSKGYKDRIVYMSDDIRDLCIRFDQYYSRLLPEREYFFQASYAKKHYINQNVCITFDTILKEMSFYPFLKKKATTHGLRHLFAVNSMKKCLEAGEDFNNRIQYLSRYMGHSGIEETMYYLHMTAQLFPIYEAKLKKLAEGIGVSHVEE